MRLLLIGLLSGLLLLVVGCGEPTAVDRWVEARCPYEDYAKNFAEDLVDADRGMEKDHGVRNHGWVGTDWPMESPKRYLIRIKTPKDIYGKRGHGNLIVIFNSSCEFEDSQYIPLYVD